MVLAVGKFSLDTLHNHLRLVKGIAQDSRVERRREGIYCLGHLDLLDLAHLLQLSIFGPGANGDLIVSLSAINHHPFIGAALPSEPVLAHLQIRPQSFFACVRAPHRGVYQTSPIL